MSHEKSFRKCSCKLLQVISVTENTVKATLVTRAHHVDNTGERFTVGTNLKVSFLLVRQWSHCFIEAELFHLQKFHYLGVINVSSKDRNKIAWPSG